jgi:catechol 2,3-dioxygenase-like lactoylglutathione lyase family enzyme
MTLEVPGTNGGQHFFFDVGRGEALAFFYIPGGPEREVPLDCIGAPFAVGLMNHAAFQVRAEDFDAYLQKIADLGVRYTYIRHDTDNVTSFDPAEGANDKTFAMSVYFADPDGNIIEFCAWLPPYESLGVTLDPASPADR